MLIFARLFGYDLATSPAPCRPEIMCIMKDLPILPMTPLRISKLWVCMHPDQEGRIVCYGPFATEQDAGEFSRKKLAERGLIIPMNSPLELEAPF